jgi:integral membrane protein
VLRELRIASIAEAVSYLALLVATVIKQTGGTESGVTALGPIHGILYLIFVGLIAWYRKDLGWTWMKAFIAMIIGSLPFGGFWIDRKWLAPLAAETEPVGT